VPQAGAAPVVETSTGSGNAAPDHLF